MKKIFILSFLFVLGLTVHAQKANAILGKWYTENNKSVVEVYQENGHFYGKMIELKTPIDPDTGKPKLDKENPDAKLQKRPLLGLIIMDGLKEGTITAYSNESDQFLVPLTYQELIDKMERSDSVRLPRADNPDILYDTVIKTEFDPSNVKKLKIKEDFYFDRQRSVVEVRILGICPVVDEIDKTTGEKRFEKNLFWIYFPECRNLFAKNEMFNLKNGSAGRMTYDDVFMKRMFSSYIYKEENVYDRAINEYSTGVDALLEAEKAKKDLFEFESNLWEY
jgi:gliding motility associated protien GldN